jgi:hypothetical protein
MTSSEDLLRDALDDLAPGAPADERAFAGIGRAITRRRRRRAQVRMAAVAAVAVAALGTAALVGGRPDQTGTVGQPDDPSGEQDNGPDPGTEPGGDEDPSAVPDAGQDVAEGTVTKIGPVANFVLPAGWDVSPRDEFWLDMTGPESEEHPYTFFCLTRPTDAETPECALEMFHGDVPGESNEAPYNPEAGWAWHRGTDVVICPGSSDYDDIVLPVDDGDYDPVQTGTRKIGGLDALYSRWDVECSVSGHTFSPQGWYLPEEQVLIIDVVGQPETEAILDSFRFDDEAG